LVGEKIFDLWQSASVNLEQTILTYQDQLVETGKKVAWGIMDATGGMVQILASFIIAGILLVIEGVGESIRGFFIKLAGEKGDEYADVTMSTVGGVVKEIIGVALILALIHGVIFLLADIPLAGLSNLKREFLFQEVLSPRFDFIVIGRRSKTRGDGRHCEVRSSLVLFYRIY
jgi:predicted PurR-regulated permease PerM